MAVEVELVGTGGIGEIVDFGVTEDATPIVAGDSSGSVGQLSVTARAITTGPVAKRSGAVIGDEVILKDSTTIDGTWVKGLGEIRGQVTRGTLPGERVSISAETILSRFNADRTAKAFYGTFQPPTTSVTYRTNYATNPSRETNLNNVTANAAFQGTAPTLSRPTSGGVSGQSFARATWTTNDTAADGGMFDNITGITGGTSYTFSGYYRATRNVALTPIGSPVQRVRLLVRFYDVLGATVSSDADFYETLRQGEWVRISAPLVAPLSAVSAKMYIISATGTNYAPWKIGDTLDSDALLVERGGLGSFFDANTATTVVTDEPGNLVTTTTYSWTGAANASQSLMTVTARQIVGTGYDATQGNYFRYLCDLVGIPSARVDDPMFDEIPVAYKSWTGNVWKFLKDFCVAIRAEVALVDDVVVLRRIRTRTLEFENLKGASLSVDSTLSSQFINIYNYNSRWGTDQLAHRATTTYQIESGAIRVNEVTVPHSLDFVNNPVPVDEFDETYSTGVGQYTIVDSQGLNVDARWWTAEGGRVDVELVKKLDESTLRITIKGPRENIAAYVGPFRLGRDQGDIIPALDITGSGVFNDRKSVRMRTGVGPEQTSTVDGSVIDNVFLTNTDLVFSRGIDAACAAAGPVVRLTGTFGGEVQTSGQEFGVVPGSRIKYADNIFRITSVNYSRAGMNFSAVADMVFGDLVDLYSYTFADFNREYAGFSFANFNAAMGDMTFAEFNAQLPSPTFDFFNKLYAGASFGDHAVYPYLSEVPHD